MTIDMGKVINDKLEAMKKERVIENKIEEVIEKTILDVVTSQLSSYSLKHELEKQIEESIHDIAGDIGLTAYNGFIATKVKEIASTIYEKDLVDKLSEKLSSCLLRKYESVKLSDIFKKYRKWLLEYTDEAEKYDRRQYCAELETNEDGNFTTYIIKLSDEELGYSDRPQIMFRIVVYGNKESEDISSLFINGKWLDNTLNIGRLTEFEAFIVNLYYNKTPIILDVDDVDDNNWYDVDC